MVRLAEDKEIEFVNKYMQNEEIRLKGGGPGKTLSISGKLPFAIKSMHLSSAAGESGPLY